MWVAVLLTAIASVAVINVTVTNHWNGGFQGKFTITTDHAIHGWGAHIACFNSLDSLEFTKSTVVDSKEFTKDDYKSLAPVRTRLCHDAVPAVFDWNRDKLPRETYFF